MRNKVQTQANAWTGNDLLYQLTILRRAWETLGRPTVVNRRLFEGTALSWDTLKIVDWCQPSFILLWIRHSHYNVIQCIYFPPFVRGTTSDRWFPSQKPVAWNFDALFDLCLKKRLSEQSRRRWFETSLRSLSCHCNAHWLPSRVSFPLTVIIFNYDSRMCVWLDVFVNRPLGYRPQNNKFPYRRHGANLDIMKSDPVTICCQWADKNILYNITVCELISYCLLIEYIDCVSIHWCHNQNFIVYGVYLIEPSYAIWRHKPVSTLILVMSWSNSDWSYKGKNLKTRVRAFR